MDREFLKELLRTCSVSGREEEIQKKALAFGKSFAHRQISDPSGNAVSVVNPDAPCKVLLCGHIDEIGFVVTHIDEKGLVHVAKAGGVRPRLYVGAQMQIIHEGEKVSGVVAVTPELLKQEEVKPQELLIDIGAACEEEAKKAVSVGDPVCTDTEPKELLNDLFTGRALDDRTGAFVVLESAKLAAQKGSEAGIYAATTVGEETTGRGAYYAASRLSPTCALAVDVTWASDAPGTDPGETGHIKLGAGPVLCLGSSVNKTMNRLLEETAKELQIPVQWEVATGRTGTDGDTVNMTGAGVPMALVSIPLRYMHSSAEVGSWKDLEGCIELLSEFLLRLPKKLSEGMSLSPLNEGVDF